MHSYSGAFGSVEVLSRAFRADAADDRDVVPGELLAGEQFAQLQLNQVEELLVVHHVDLVQEDDDGGHFDLAGEQDVLARLRHRAVGRGHDEDGAVHLGGAGDHVLDVVRVARAVDVGVVTRLRLVLDVGNGDGDAAGALFRRVVDRIERAELRAALHRQHLRDRRRERRLAVVDVTNRAYVHVRLVPLKFRLRHGLYPPVVFAGRRPSPAL